MIRPLPGIDEAAIDSSSSEIEDKSTAGRRLAPVDELRTQCHFGANADLERRQQRRRRGAKVDLLIVGVTMFRC